MNYFLNQFRDNLDGRPQPPFEERDWRDLEKRLDRQNKKRPAALWFFVLPLLAASLTGNLFLLKKLQHQRPKMAAVVAASHSDTVFVARIEWRRDTIFKTRTVMARHSSLYAIDHEVPKQQPSAESLLHIEAIAAQPDPDSRFAMAASSVIPQNESLADSFMIAKTPLLPLRPAPLLHVLPPIPTVAFHAQATKKRKSLAQTVRILRPTTFSLGASGGWNIPSATGVQQRNGWSAGAEAQLGFSQGLRLWADVRYAEWRFVATRMDAALGIPAVPPPSDDFVFKKADAAQPSWQFSTGFQYAFAVKWRAKPFVGLGLGITKRLPYTVDYEFMDPATGIEWNVDRRVASTDHLSNFLSARTGWQTSLFPRWEAMLRFEWRLPLSPATQQLPSVFGLEAGVRKNF